MIGSLYRLCIFWTIFTNGCSSAHVASYILSCCADGARGVLGVSNAACGTIFTSAYKSCTPYCRNRFPTTLNTCRTGIQVIIFSWFALTTTIRSSPRVRTRWTPIITRGPACQRLGVSGGTRGACFGSLLRSIFSGSTVGARRSFSGAILAGVTPPAFPPLSTTVSCITVDTAASRFPVCSLFPTLKSLDAHNATQQKNRNRTHRSHAPATHIVYIDPSVQMHATRTAHNSTHMQSELMHPRRI